MADSHDKAAKKIAKKLQGTYDPSSSPDVKGKLGRAEVKSTAAEMPKALRQLIGGAGPAYVALPKSEQKGGINRLQGRKTGLMDHRGNIIKPSTRKARRCR